MKNKKCIGQFYLTRIQVMMEIARKNDIYLRSYNTVEEMYLEEKVSRFNFNNIPIQNSFLSPGKMWIVSEDIDLSDFWKEVNKISPRISK